MKREACDVAVRLADLLPVPVPRNLAADRARGVLDHRDATASGQRENRQQLLFPFIQTLGQQTLDNINPAFVLSQGPRLCRNRPARMRDLDRAYSAYSGQWQRLCPAVEPEPAKDLRAELEC